MISVTTKKKERKKESICKETSYLMKKAAMNEERGAPSNEKVNENQKAGLYCYVCYLS